MGSVILDIYCVLEKKGTPLYTFSFTEPRGTHRFNILDDTLSLDHTLINELIQIIENYFINVILQLEENPRKAVEQLGVRPVVQAEDYSWTYYVERELLEHFLLKDLFHLFDKNSADFNKLSNRVTRNFDSFYYYMISRNYVDITHCKSCKKQDLLVLARKAHLFLQSTERYNEYQAEMYRQIAEDNTHDIIWLSLAVYNFCSDNYFRSNPNAKKFVEIIESFHNFIYRDEACY